MLYDITYFYFIFALLTLFIGFHQIKLPGLTFLLLSNQTALQHMPYWQKLVNITDLITFVDTNLTKVFIAITAIKQF